MLFKLVKAPGSEGGEIGYDWLEVIAIIPRCQVQGIDGSWIVEHDFLCKIPEHGLMTVDVDVVIEHLFEEDYIIEEVKDGPK
jgi:hypothetical protein